MDSPDNNRKPITRLKTQGQFANELGRIPPQAVDIEQVVLGAMMLEKNAVNDTIDILNQNTGISRDVFDNIIIDRQVNRLGRYFMLSFNLRLNKFGGRSS